jgi:hypothetical protein
MQYVLKNYYNNSCKKPDNFTNLENLRFACNQEPEMMDVFVKLNNDSIIKETGSKYVF